MDDSPSNIHTNFISFSYIKLVESLDSAKKPIIYCNFIKILK